MILLGCVRVVVRKMVLQKLVKTLKLSVWLGISGDTEEGSEKKGTWSWRNFWFPIVT